MLTPVVTFPIFLLPSPRHGPHCPASFVGALWCCPWSADSKTRGAADRCHRRIEIRVRALPKVRTRGSAHRPTSARADGPLVSGCLFEGLVHAFPDRLGGFGCDPLRQRRQFLRLFRQRFKLLAQLGRRQLDRLGRRFRREEVGGVIESRVDIRARRFDQLDAILARALRSGLVGILEATRHVLGGVFKFVVVFLYLERFFSAKSRNSEGKSNFPRNLGSANGGSPIAFDFALEEGVCTVSSTI
jgi:hypothetical protein